MAKSTPAPDPAPAAEPAPPPASTPPDDPRWAKYEERMAALETAHGETRERVDRHQQYIEALEAELAEAEKELDAAEAQKAAADTPREKADAAAAVSAAKAEVADAKQALQAKAPDPHPRKPSALERIFATPR